MVVRLLFDAGADVLAKTNKGQTPEDMAVTGSHSHVAAMLKAEAVRRAQCEAFATGQHERLGSGSWVRCLDAGVARMVMDFV